MLPSSLARGPRRVCNCLVVFFHRAAIINFSYLSLMLAHTILRLQIYVELLLNVLHGADLVEECDRACIALTGYSLKPLWSTQVPDARVVDHMGVACYVSCMSAPPNSCTGSGCFCTRLQGFASPSVAAFAYPLQIFVFSSLLHMAWAGEM